MKKWRDVRLAELLLKFIILQFKETLKGNSGLKLKLFCMFGLCPMSQFLITSFPYRFIRIKYST